MFAGRVKDGNLPRMVGLIAALLCALGSSYIHAGSLEEIAPACCNKEPDSENLISTLMALERGVLADELVNLFLTPRVTRNSLYFTWIAGVAGNRSPF